MTIPALTGMLFLVDEDSEAGAIVGVLGKLGHQVVLATEALRGGAKDPEVAQHAENMGAIVVTRNKVDFWRMLQPRPEASPRRFRRAGALFLMCTNSRLSARRVSMFDNVLRREHERVLDERDPRFLVEVLEHRVVVHR